MLKEQRKRKTLTQSQIEKRKFIANKNEILTSKNLMFNEEYVEELNK